MPHNQFCPRCGYLIDPDAADTTQVGGYRFHGACSGARTRGPDQPDVPQAPEAFGRGGDRPDRRRPVEHEHPEPRDDAPAS